MPPERLTIAAPGVGNITNDAATPLACSAPVWADHGSTQNVVGKNNFIVKIEAKRGAINEQFKSCSLVVVSPDFSVRVQENIELQKSRQVLILQKDGGEEPRR